VIELNRKRALVGSALIALSAVAVGAYRYYQADNEPTQDHRYALKREDLKPGDILLYRAQKKSIVSSIIRWWTGSPYSHAAIYLGDGKILEALFPRIKINPLKIQRGGYIGIVRSQYEFGPERVEVLHDFANQLVKNKARYDTLGVLQFIGIKSNVYRDNIAAVLAGAADIRGDARTRYFCSALVARTYCIVGIADESAWSIFLGSLKSPGDIPLDINFGWFLGYLIPPGTTVPNDDPMQKGTIWKEVIAAHSDADQ
jgi:hypothetical protein